MSDHVGHRQRLREQFLAGEDCSYTDEAILELLLTYAIPQKDVRPIAERLLETFGGLDGVLQADLPALCAVPGIKAASATLLKLVDWIRREYDGESQTVNDGGKKVSIYQAKLFDTSMPLDERPIDDANQPKLESPPPAPPSPRYVIPRHGTLLFARAVLGEAIDLLPRLPDTQSLDEITTFLRNNVPVSAEQTRARYAQYIVRRMFPEGYADSALRSFAQKYAGRQELRDACFYRFCKGEPLMIDIVDALLLPSIGSGRLDRGSVQDYVRNRFPMTKSLDDHAWAIVDALKSAGIVRAEPRELLFSYRNILIPSFAFVLHSEFPTPGMYNISQIEQNPAIKAMLWNPDRLLQSLYELRNLGLIAKVSEIDTFRQFTTRWTLAEVVDRLAPDQSR